MNAKSLRKHVLLEHCKEHFFGTLACTLIFKQNVNFNRFLLLESLKTHNFETSMIEQQTVPHLVLFSPIVGSL